MDAAVPILALAKLVSSHPRVMELHAQSVHRVQQRGLVTKIHAQDVFKVRMQSQTDKLLVLLAMATPKIAAPGLQVYARMVTSLQMLTVLFAQNVLLGLLKSLVTKTHVPHVKKISMNFLLDSLLAAEHVIPNLMDVVAQVRAFAKPGTSLITAMAPSAQNAQWVKPKDLVKSNRVSIVLMLHMPYQRRKLLVHLAMPNLMDVAVPLRVLAKRVISLLVATVLHARNVL